MSATADVIKNESETMSSEVYSFLADMGYSDAKIEELRAASKIADSYLVSYSISPVVSGTNYMVYGSVSFNDAYLNYHGPYKGYASSQTTSTHNTGMESVSTFSTFTASSTSVGFSGLKFFYEDQNYDFESCLGNMTLTSLYSFSGNNLTQLSVGNYTVSREVYALGDVTGNGIVNQSDISKLVGAFTGSTTLTVDERICADVNMDGLLDVNDVSVISSWMNSTGTTPIWDY